MSKKTIDRLNQLLDDQDEEIRELKHELAQAEAIMDADVWGWTMHRESDEADGLPVPRLEMRWEAQDDSRYNWRCRYDLVYRHFLGHVMRIPMGMTRSCGGNGSHINNGVVDTPFRDGAHITHDAYCLKLPAYAICDDVITTLEPKAPHAYDPAIPWKPEAKKGKRK